MTVDRTISEAELQAAEQIADALLEYQLHTRIGVPAMLELAGQLADIARQCADIAYSEASSSVQIVVLTPDVIQ